MQLIKDKNQNPSLPERGLTRRAKCHSQYDTVQETDYEVFKVSNAHAVLPILVRLGLFDS